MASDLIGLPGGAVPANPSPWALLLDEQEASAAFLAEALTRRGYRVAVCRGLDETATALDGADWRAVALVFRSATFPLGVGPNAVDLPPVPLVRVGEPAAEPAAAGSATLTLAACLDRPVTEAALDSALGRCAQWEAEAGRLVRHRVYLRQAQFVREPVARIVHDLNNQITGLRGGVDLLAFAVQQVQPVELRNRFGRYLMEIVQPSLATIEQMFVQCRRAREQAAPAVVPVDLREAVREALALTIEPAVRRRTTVCVEGQAAAPGDDAARQPAVCVAADRDHVVLLLAYLLDNARDAIAGSDAGEIRVEIAGPGAQNLCRVAVFDNGAGIADERRALVWRSFYSTKSGSHSGLGLAFAKQLADRHGGQIGLVASPLGGAGVQVLLPAAPDGAGGKA